MVEIIQDDRHVTVDTIARTLGTGHNAVQEMIESLGYRKVCAPWVPRLLTKDHKGQRKSITSELLQRYRHDTFQICEGSAAWTTLGDNGGNSESSASVSSDGWNGVLGQGNFQTSRTLGEMCTKKWRLCGKIKKGM